MTITTEILYRCLQRFFQKNDNKRVKLTELFPENLVDGKLILKNIDMYRLIFPKDIHFDVKLQNIDFENCVFENCDFSYLWLDPRDFKSAVFRDSYFEGTYKSTEKQKEPVLTQRENSWFLKIHENYPQDYYVYKKHVRDDNVDQDFYLIIPPSFDDVFSQTLHLGWKLHISVNPDDLAKAFELAAPIISRYGYTFKIVNLRKINFADGKEAVRFYRGTQFTIYLEENNQLKTSVEKTQRMMNEIETAFLHASIRQGKIPDSDAPTTFNYFSLRNDKFDFEDFFIDEALSVERGIPFYLGSRFVGLNYNPLGRTNPYLPVLSNKKEFNLIKHFSGFKPENYHEAFLVYIACLCAWLNEHTRVLEASAPEKIALKKLCFSKNAKIEDHIFRAEQNATVEFSVAVKLLLCYLTWLNQKPYLNCHFFPLSTLYPYTNSFLTALIEMESKVNKFQNTNNLGNDDASFAEFLQQNLYEEANTVEQEGEFNKPQKLGVNEDGRIRDYSMLSPHRPTPKP